LCVSTQARAEIAYAASFVEFYSEEAKRIEGGVLPGPTPSKRILASSLPYNSLDGLCIMPGQMIAMRAQTSTLSSLGKADHRARTNLSCLRAAAEPVAIWKAGTAPKNTQIQMVK
jgi:hypothetical protein